MLGNLGFYCRCFFQLEVISLGKMSLSLQHLQYLLSEFFRQMGWPVRLDHLLSMTQNHSPALTVTEEAELLGLLPKQPTFLSIWHSWIVKRLMASAEASWHPVWRPGCQAILPFLVHTRLLNYRMSPSRLVRAHSTPSLHPFDNSREHVLRVHDVPSPELPGATWIYEADTVAPPLSEMWKLRHWRRV